MDALVHDHGAQRRAPLPGGAEAGEQRRLHREVEIRAWCHDHRVLAAKFQAGRLQIPAGELADPGPDRAGPGEADLVDQSLGQCPLQPGERRLAAGEHQVQDAVGQPAAAGEQVEQCRAARGGVVGRLPHHGVAAQQGRDEIPRRHGDREVAGGDDAHHADRVAEREQLLVRHLARHRLAVEPAPLAQEEVTGVDDLAHLAERFGVRLADLPGHQPCQRLGVSLDHPADMGDRAAAHRRRHIGPGLLCLPGRSCGGDERASVPR